MPKVSVIICVYNQPLVKEAIESVLAQSYPDYELIIIDDGSEDETQKVLSSYQAYARIFHQPNQGVAPARNQGLILARGEYIAFLDADDLWLPDYLEKMVEFLETHPGSLFAFSDGWVFNQKDVPENLDQFPTYHTVFPPPSEDNAEFLTFKSPPITSLMVFKREFFARVGFFSPELKINEDADLLLRSAELGIKYIFLNQPLGIKRNLATGLSQNPVECLYYSRLIAKKSWERSKKLHRYIRQSLLIVNLYLAKAYFQQGDKSQARKLLREIIYFRPWSIRVLWLLSLLCLPSPLALPFIKKSFLATPELFPKLTVKDYPRPSSSNKEQEKKS